MEITFPEINPYIDTLLKKAEKAQTPEEFEEICAVVEYVDKVQVSALVESNSLVSEDFSSEEIQRIKEIEEFKENDPMELLKKMYDDLKNENPDNDEF